MKACALLLATLMACHLSHAQIGIVRGNVDVQHQKKKSAGNADVVVWLTPYQTHSPVVPGPSAHLLQKNKQFLPHVVAITMGTTVEFPNRDPFFHDVFSIYHGKPFDLGLYESGSSRKVAFTKPGVSYIFCNIHPQMSAIVIALETPYVASTDQAGAFAFNGVPEGRYRMEVWHERATPEHLATLSRVLQVGPADVDLGSLRISEEGYIPQPHRNKHGEEYDSRGNRPAYRKP